MGMLDFVSGIGQTGAQIGLEQIRSMTEEERAKRLAEFTNDLAVKRDNSQSQLRVGEHRINSGVDQKREEALIQARGDKEVEVANRKPQLIPESVTLRRYGQPDFTAPKTPDPDTGIRVASSEKIAREQIASHEKVAAMQLGGIQSVQTDPQSGALFGMTRDGKTVAITDPSGKPMMGQKNLPAAQAKLVDVLNDQVKAIDKHIADTMLDPTAKAALEKRRAVLNVEILGTLTGGGFVDRFDANAPKPRQQPAAPSSEPAQRKQGAGTSGDRQAILMDELDAERERLADAKAKNKTADIERAQANVAALERELGGSKRAEKPAESTPTAKPAARPAARVDLEAEGAKLEDSDKELKTLGNMMRLTEGGRSAAARASYLQRVRDLLEGKKSPAIGTPIAPGLINSPSR